MKNKDLTDKTGPVRIYGSGRAGKIIRPALIACFLFLGSYALNAQDSRDISGRVVSSGGSPIAGVTVVNQQTLRGAVTNGEGLYTIGDVSPGSVLLFSFLGMNPVRITVGTNTTINVTMTEQTTGIDDVVVVGYGTQRRGNITGSVASIGNKELVDVPVASATALLGGKLPGLVSLQQSGQPGADEALLRIRGFESAALVIVDGVETNFNNIDPNQIESVSILKDGSASIYGSRAGSGVILVTTKRGTLGKPVITVNSSMTFQGMTSFPKPVSSGQYAEMAVEQWRNQGSPGTAPFTDEEVRKYYEGGDPQYPNTDWFDVLTRKWAPQQQHNISVRGGNDRIKYFGLLGFLDQRSMWKDSEAFYKRYNVQSNIDARILDNLTLQIDINARIEDRNFTARDWGQEIWNAVWTTLPTVPSSFPDPTKIPSAQLGGGVAAANLVTNRKIWGYNDTDAENYSGSISLKYDFKSVQGLSVKIFGNYMKNYNVAKYFQKGFTLYNYDYAADLYTISGQKSDVELNIRDDFNKTLTGNLSVNYDRTFGGDHHISALALMEGIDSDNSWIRAFRKGFLTSEIDQMFAGSSEGMISDGSAGEMGRLSYVGRFTYSYKNKYLLESTFRADASARFPKEHQWSYFPSVSLGWRISEENFMSDISSLDMLKLRASYGKLGNDEALDFQYLTGYTFNDTYVFQGTTIEQGLISTGLANPLLTWEKMTIYNVGADLWMFNGRFYSELDLFYRKRTGIPFTRSASLPSTFGASLPQENINSQNDRGFEFKAGTHGQRNGFVWDLSANISWARRRWVHYEESDFEDADQKRVYGNSGRWTDRIMGYKTDGLFTSQAEIDALTYDQDQQGNSTLRPGDLKYIDVNEDGVIDWKDQVVIGKGPLPNWMMGLTGNFQYRGFDLGLFFQGAFGHSVYANFNPQNTVSPEYRYELRWTEDNNDAKAKIPRLGGSGMNDGNTDYRLKKASYLRLKRLSLGYSFDIRGVQQLRLYIAGTNLLTIKHKDMRDFSMDPEMPSGRTGQYYPQQRTISFGVNLSF